MEYIRVTKENIEKEHICCAISSNKDMQVISKKNWLKERFDDGLVFLCQPLRKSLFWQIRSSLSTRDLQSAMKRIMVFSSGICLFLWMRLSLNLRSVRSIHTLSRQAMYCTIPINVRLMPNIFRYFLKLPRKERFRFKQSDWKQKKKRRMFRHRLQPMHYFITENMSRMSR